MEIDPEDTQPYRYDEEAGSMTALSSAALEDEHDLSAGPLTTTDAVEKHASGRLTPPAFFLPRDTDVRAMAVEAFEAAGFPPPSTIKSKSSGATLFYWPKGWLAPEMETRINACLSSSSRELSRLKEGRHARQDVLFFEIPVTHSSSLLEVRDYWLYSEPKAARQSPRK